MLKLLKELKRELGTKYLHSSDLLNAQFKTILDWFSKESTIVVLLNKDLSIKQRYSIKRNKVKEVVKIPVYGKDIGAGIIDRRIGLTITKIETKTYCLIDLEEPFIYLEN